MASFDILNDDVIMCIMEYLNDFDKINFLSINKNYIILLIIFGFMVYMIIN
ncbi:putative F-box and FNIP repeat-containing protein [Megavirus courdo7]|uniref:Putative F-box and FNIP repeat-containing protein n=1 Tax=Megavirus courdo7 TaxID=1128135 RepID=H2E9W3_9VIRU|nr:putative F-box and FNIP repeat-containing protein [Megavirus courdo7]